MKFQEKGIREIEFKRARAVQFTATVLWIVTPGIYLEEINLQLFPAIAEDTEAQKGDVTEALRVTEVAF